MSISVSRIQFVFIADFTILKHFALIISLPRGVRNEINLKEHPRSFTDSIREFNITLKLSYLLPNVQMYNTRL